MRNLSDGRMPLLHHPPGLCLDASQVSNGLKFLSNRRKAAGVQPIVVKIASSQGAAFSPPILASTISNDFGPDFHSAARG